MDLRGFGESSTRPTDALFHPGDVLETLDELDVDRFHLVGASYGSGVAVETALIAPDRIESLLLVAPAGSLLAELTPDLKAFFEGERTALQVGDLDAAVEANVATWVVGTQRRTQDTDPTIIDGVRRMQRRAFEVTAGWKT